ncbi:MAG: iron ABC transporter permease, partial [Candidimonas sp.]
MKTGDAPRNYWRDHVPVAGISFVLFVLCFIPVILVTWASLSTAVPRPGNSTLGHFTLAHFVSLITPSAATAF